MLGCATGAASSGCSRDRAAAASAAEAGLAATAASDGGAVVACVGQPPPRTFSEAIEPGAVMRAMTAVADWQLANPARWATNLWHYAAFWVGMTSLANVAEDPKYYDAIEKNGEANGWRPAARPGHADDQAITASYAYVYSVERDRRMIGPTQARFDEMTTKAFDEPLTWDETAAPIRDREWAWCDALFMAPPAMAQTSASVGDPKYFQLANRLWWKTTEFLYDKAERLYYRDSRFFQQKEPNGKKVFWSRGNGWVLAGAVRMLENMPQQDPDRGRYETLLREMAARIAPLQGSDGFWRASLLDPDSVPKPESSGTAFYVYAFAWGMNQGILDRATFEPVIRKGWTALTGAVLPAGKLGWVQEVGFKPGDVCWDRTEVYGAGGFLLAGSEVYRSALLGDSPRITRVLKNPLGEARVDEAVELPLQPEEAAAVAAGSKLVAVDGRSGTILPTRQPSSKKGPLAVLVSFYASEERLIHVYRVPKVTPSPPARSHGFGGPSDAGAAASTRKQAPIGVALWGVGSQ
jgi:rhamnogalacturonyl hydrolase YesR